MRIKRIVSRIFFHFGRFLLKVISLFNHRTYMYLYVRYLSFYGMKISGMPRYIGINVKFDDFNKIYLGDRVVISDECYFLTHDYSYTTALISIGNLPSSDIALIREISVGNNVFIGKRSIIMPNSKIGNNVIIGAGSVVRGIISDNSVVLGNPGKIVGSVTDLAGKWLDKDFENFLRID